MILFQNANKLFLFYFKPNILDFDLFYSSEIAICEEVLGIFIPDDGIIP
jgi:hypothetical protein